MRKLKHRLQRGKERKYQVRMCTSLHLQRNRKTPGATTLDLLRTKPGDTRPRVSQLINKKPQEDEQTHGYGRDEGGKSEFSGFMTFSSDRTRYFGPNHHVF